MIKEWRPEGLTATGVWVKYVEADNIELSEEVNTEKLIEFAFTAMLESLRQQGYHVDHDTSFCSVGERRTLSNKGVTGTWAFIPDDEVQL